MSDINIIKIAIREVLAETGLISPFINRPEIIAQIGRHRYEKAIKSGLLKRNKANGKNASVRVKRTDFTELLLTGKI
jgi:hypothetical protein